MKIQLIITIALISGLTACKKSENKDSINIKNETYAFADAAVNATSPDNAANSYDSAGYWHNAILTGIQPCVSHSNSSLDGITGCVIKFADKQVPALPVSSVAPIERVVKDRENNFTNIITSLPYSDHIKAIIGTLIKLVEDTTHKSYGSIKAPIVALEGQIIKDNSLDQQDKKLLLEAASIARYSTFYWMNINPEGQALRLKNILKWGAWAAGDITGFLATGNVSCAADCSEAMYYLVDVYWEFGN